MRRTPQEIAELDHQKLSNWQLFKLTFVCGHIDGVKIPENAVATQRWLIRFANIFTDHTPAFGWKRLAVGVVMLVTGVISMLYAGDPTLFGASNNWTRFLPLTFQFMGWYSLGYICSVAAFNAGADELVVEAYKDRVAKKLAKRQF